MSSNFTFSRNPVISIVGRSNVGKSALFNKLVGKRISVVHDSLGVTRDRVCADFSWNSRLFTLIDTGGLDFSSDDIISSMINGQVNFAVNCSDIILFVVDAKSGIVPVDKDIAIVLRKKSKPVILCVNKCDKPNEQSLICDFYSLGFSDIIPISSVHGHGTGDLLDLICNKVSDYNAQEEYQGIKVAILGKPNVGKSSIVNRICGYERSIVADFSGTTRDSIDSFINYEGTNYLIIDTAGIKKKSNISSEIEKYSTFRSLDSAERSDVCLLVLDAFEGITSQDARIAGIIKNYFKSSIILVNKWDKLDPNKQNVLNFEKKIKRAFQFFSYVPVLYISAKTGRNFEKIFSLIQNVYDSFTKRISTGLLNSFLREVILRTPTPSIKGRQLKIYYMTQSDASPPTFVFFVNKSKLFHFSYQRHIENELRKSFGFSGTPLKFIIRQKGELVDNKAEKF